MELIRVVAPCLIGVSMAICHCSVAQCDEEHEPGKTGNIVVHEIKPSTTDSSIRRFDEPHEVLFDQSLSPAPPLVVFMPGTDGKPSNTLGLLRVVANQGYRVIGLEYNDSPAVVQVCPRKPPNCSGDFRRKRIFGDGASGVVDDTAAESIVNRLAKLLQYLAQTQPTENWSEYLQDDAPDWSRIVVSGLSQGAGMAAYIAQRKLVARVVLFSSPWDYSVDSQSLAPWISGPSVTPPERWFAEYHRRENTANLIAQAYAVLHIPAEHIRVFDLDLPADRHGHRSDNPYHGSTIHVPGYAPEWRFLFGP